MVARPERHVDAFADAGADRILAQVEATPTCTTPSPPSASATSRRRGHQSRHAVEAVAEVVDDVELVLCMTGS